MAMLLVPAFGTAQDAGGTRAPAPVAGVTTEGLDGDWDGVIKIGAGQLRCAFHINSKSGATTATMDSIDQGVSGIPVSAVVRRGDTVRLEVVAIGGAFEGQLSADARTISGEWIQAGQKMPLTLARRAAGLSQPELRRPQNPVKPYPYREEDVSFENASARTRLAGTLTLPQGSGRFPAVVLIAGSGPNDRNETVFGHQIFLADSGRGRRHRRARRRLCARTQGHAGSGARTGAGVPRDRRRHPARPQRFPCVREARPQGGDPRGRACAARDGDALRAVGRARHPHPAQHAGVQRERFSSLMRSFTGTTFTACSSAPARATISSRWRTTARSKTSSRTTTASR